MSSKRATSEAKGLGLMPKSPAEALEPTRPPKRPKAMRPRREVRRLGPAMRVLNGAMTFLVVALGLGGALTFWMGKELGQDGPLKETKSIVVRKGDGARDIAQRLEAEGIIQSHHIFTMHYVGRSLAAWVGAKPFQLKAGEYEFPPASSVRQVAEIIGEGRSVLYRFTIPEGLTSAQIVERLKADTNLTGDIRTVPPEGSMLPETFRVPRGATRQSAIELMQAELKKLVESAWAGRQQGLPFQTMEEAMVLASIVDRETGRNDKHADIASVFINRLRKGMQLQSDPTILYGLMGGGVNWGKPITKPEIQSRTAHNTYVIKGLPPTPICNPSRTAIAAVLNPSQTNYLYFVAGGNGASVFSQTLEEHNAAVVNWRKIEQGIRAKQAETAAQTRVVSRPAPAPVEGQPATQPATESAQPAIAPPAAVAPAPPVTPTVLNVAPAAAQPAAATATPAATGSDVPLPTRKPKR
jgi:UPF0755 protein